MKSVGNRTIGMLLDTYILTVTENALSDSVTYSNESEHDLMNTILEALNDKNANEAIESIVSLAVNRAIISTIRACTLESDITAVHDINAHNFARTEAVREIDSIFNPDDLSYSKKTYGDNHVTTKTPLSIILDDLVTSKIKFLIDESSELAERIESLEKFIADVSNDDGLSIIDVINLVLATSLVFFIHEATERGHAVRTEARETIEEIVKCNKIRKLAMSRIGGNQ